MWRTNIVSRTVPTTMTQSRTVPTTMTQSRTVPTTMTQSRTVPTTMTQVRMLVRTFDELPGPVAAKRAGPRSSTSHAATSNTMPLLRRLPCTDDTGLMQTCFHSNLIRILRRVATSGITIWYVGQMEKKVSKYKQHQKGTALRCAVEEVLL